MLAFESPKSYNEMLNKIAIYTLFIIIGCWYLILRAFPNIDKALSDIFPNGGIIKLVGMDFRIYFLLIPIPLAIAARSFRLHDRISDVFKMRKNYDLYNILLPLAIGSGYFIMSIEKINDKRKLLMNSCFYKYASYSQPQIDEHFINTALDFLCWYWIAVEGQFFAIITLLVSLVSNDIIVLKLTIVANLVFYVFGKVINYFCKQRTSDEVLAILNDEQRKQEILQEYSDAL